MLTPQMIQDMNKVTGMNKPVDSTQSFAQNRVAQINSIAKKSAAAKTAQDEAAKANSFGGISSETIKGVGNDLISSEKGVGESLGQSAASTDVNKNVTESNSQLKDMQIKVLHQIAQDKSAGKDTTHLENAYNSITEHAGTDAKDILPAVNKSNLQAVLETAGVGADILSAGTYGAATKGTNLAKLSTPELTTAIKGMLPGLQHGMAADIAERAASAAQKGQPIEQFVKDELAKVPNGSLQTGLNGTENAPKAAMETGKLAEATPSAATAIKSVVDKVVPPIKEAAQNIEKASVDNQAAKAKSIADKELQKSVEDVMPLQDKQTRIDELRNSFPDSSPGKGGVTREGTLGKSTPQPTAGDIARGTDAHPYIKGTKDPVVKISKLNQGIKDVSTKTDEFLNSKAAPGHFKDMIDYMETNRPSSGLQKDPGAAEAYDRATQGALDTLYKTMKSAATESGDFGPKTSGADIRAARIKIDQQISKELGENIFGSPQYKGIKAAEVDTRNLLNRMVEDMLRYPGQMENLNKMNSFITQSRERGIEIDMKNPEVRAHLEKEFKLSPTGEKDAEALAKNHETMSNLYDARDNLIDKYQSSLGQNKVQEAIKNNPAIKAGVGVAKKVIPFGIGTHL